MSRRPTHSCWLPLTDAEVARFVDERALRLRKALVSSGRNDRLYELAPADLSRQAAQRSPIWLPNQRSSERVPSRRLGCAQKIIIEPTTNGEQTSYGWDAIGAGLHRMSGPLASILPGVGLTGGR